MPWLKIKNLFRRMTAPVDRAFYDKILFSMNWKRIERKKVMLSSLRAHVYTDQGDTFIPLTDTPATKYLQGDAAAYAAYHRMENSYNVHNHKDFDNLVESLRSKGYQKNNLIVVFNRENIIRDGQHRAAALWHLHGDMEIEIADVIFS